MRKNLRVLGIDPSPGMYACVVLNAGTIENAAYFSIHGIRTLFAHMKQLDIAVEKMECFGMPVGQSVFDTCYNIGRLLELFRLKDVYLYSRREIKLHFCNTTRAKDSNIRQVMIDRYGGTKKGEPLHGIKKDLWSALAIATFHYDYLTREAG